MEIEVKPHHKEGLTGAAFIMALFFAFLFYFKMGLPDPPLSQMGSGGVELNYGTDDQGFGEDPQASPSEAAAPASDNSVQQEEPNQENAPQNEASLVEENPESEPLAEPKDNKVKNNTNTANKNTNNSNSNTQTANSNKNTGSSGNGDKPNTNGDMGKEQGNPDARALYGNAGNGDNPNGSGGSGEGASLDLDGWIWDSKPKPSDNTSESGKIVFQIKINGEGEVIAVNLIEKTVSLEVVKLYKSEVEKLTFSRLKNNLSSQSTAVGKITFIIKTK